MPDRFRPLTTILLKDGVDKAVYFIAGGLQMKVRNKLFLVQGIIITIGMAAILQTYQNTRSIEEDYERVVEETLPVLRSLEEQRLAATRLALSTSEFGLIISLADNGAPHETVSEVHLVDHETSLFEEEEGIEEGGDTLLRSFDAYSQLVADKDFVAPARLREGGWALIIAGAELRDALKQDVPPKDILALRANVDHAEKAFLSTINEQIDKQDLELQRRRDQLHNKISSAQSALITLGTLALLAALFVNLFIRRAVILPLAQLTAATSRFAKGDFTSIPAKCDNDEIGGLIRSFAHMAKELNALIRRNEAAIETAHASQIRFQDVVEASSDWIWETNAEHHLTYLSERFTEVTGRDVTSLLGQPLTHALRPRTDPATACRSMPDLASGMPFRDLSYAYQDQKGHNRVCRLAGKPIIDNNGDFQGFRGTASDMTAEVEAQAQAQHLAHHDALTGLPNRFLLAERFQQTLSNMKRGGGSVAVLCLDLDHFKDINDTLGHAAGDALLKQVAERLLGAVRQTDTVGRLGGDEFVIIQAHFEKEADTEQLCRRLTNTLAKPYDLDGHDVHTRSSIGVAIAPQDGEAHDQLLKNADLALYRAKAEGRGIYRFFEDSMNVKLQQRKALETGLRRALANDQFELHYQPQFELEGRRITGVEALIRWRHPERGIIAPMDFIPIAEETGLIMPITEWVLRKACTDALHWHGLTLAINLPPSVLRHQDLLGMIKGLLGETGFDPQRLELEITETSLLHDTERAVKILNDLRALGMQIVMDDFGTGYSSLSYLQQFPFNKIKIDRSFISALTTDNDSIAIVRAVINLGQSLGMATTAEGVETADQAQFLKGQGCDEVQGFFYARPMPAEAFSKMISGKTLMGHEDYAPP